MLTHSEKLKKGILSIVVPAYNEETNISIASNTISNLMIEASIPFEIVFIDDGSIDKTMGLN